MEAASGRPSSAGAALQLSSGNQQRDSGDVRDSSVHDKISQFNSLATQSKQLERKTADAALKRAMLGREEAEGEMRRYRDEARALRRQVEEGKERERRVGERLEAVMEKYGRTKETHAHTQALWEKEIRRARKETFKCQSTTVKLQEELKSARAAAKSAEEMLDLEKERSKAREQEAFTARYGLVGTQEQLEQALERITVLEQERDAFKALARNDEDITRIAAEGLLPLPTAPAHGAEGTDEVDEFASPRKPSRVSSVSIADVKSSASSEAEIEELTRLWQWERQRADRALEHVEFLEAECHLRCCAAAKRSPRHRSSTTTSASASATPGSARRKRPDPVKITDAGDLVILSEDGQASPVNAGRTPPLKKSKTESKTDRLRSEEKESRRSTIFVPAEGIFRTVSQSEAEAQVLAKAGTGAAAAPEESSADSGHQDAPPCRLPSSAAAEEAAATAAPASPSCYSRSPSGDPPAFAATVGQRTSLLSLLDAPHKQDEQHTGFNIPVTQGPKPGPTARLVGEPVDGPVQGQARGNIRRDAETPTQRTPLAVADKNVQNQTPATHARDPRQDARQPFYFQGDDGDGDDSNDKSSTATITPHPMAATTVTTKVPLRDENADASLATRLLALQRTPSGNSGKNRDANPSFDAANPALTPTMNREQALAQIRERRGRARSAAQGAVTPRKQMVQGVERRDVSAPTGRVGGVPSATRQVRS